MNYLFVYGLLLDPDVMQRGLGLQDVEPVGPAYLEGWQLEFRGPANIEMASEGTAVPGFIWAVPNEEAIWARLDRLEGMYNRVNVTVMRDGEPVQCWAYTMKTPLYERTAIGWPESIRETYRLHGLDESFLDAAIERAKVEEHERFGPSAYGRIGYAHRAAT